MNAARTHGLILVGGGGGAILAANFGLPGPNFS